MPDDQLSLCWLNAQRLVLSAPEPIGFDRSNWRLISVSTLKGEMTLIADALPPGVPAVAMDEVVFYCRPAGGDTTWELWASSADGLRKRLIYAARNTETLSIMDASSGRLLLNRRYLAEGSGALRSGLIELALTPLVAWRIGSSKLEAPGDERAIDFTSPDSPKPGSDADAGSPGFIPDSKGDGAAGDAADRYRRRGKGGGGTAPPDLSLPGL
jgi:hypothetical protein